MIIAGASAYSRIIDLRNLEKQLIVVVWLNGYMAHIAGLAATGLI